MAVMVVPSEAEVERLLRQVQPPPEMLDAVARWEIRVDDDWAGSPATQVVVVLKDERLPAAWPVRRRYGEDLTRALWERYPERFPYVWFSAETVGATPPRISRRGRGEP